MFKFCHQRGVGTNSESLEHTQEAGEADGEASHHSVYIKIYLTLEVILKVQWLKYTCKLNIPSTEDQHYVDEGQLTGDQVHELRFMN